MKQPRVTDHAVLRYIERVGGFDVEAVRQHIAKVCAEAVAAGATTLKHDGIRFTFSTGAVTTVMPDKPGPTGMTIAKLRRSR